MALPQELDESLQLHPRESDGYTYYTSLHGSYFWTRSVRCTCSNQLLSQPSFQSGSGNALLSFEVEDTIV